MANQTTGEVCQYETRPKQAIPARLPRMSTEYGGHAVGCRGEGAAHRLAKPDEHQGDDREEDRGDALDRHDEPAQVTAPGLGPEEDLLRRRLPADVDAQVAEMGVGPGCELGQADSDDRQGDDPGHKVGPAAGGQQADRHAEKTREEHEIGEERQEQHRAAEPADASQFQEEDGEADEEQVGVRLASLSWPGVPAIVRESALMGARAEAVEVPDIVALLCLPD